MTSIAIKTLEDKIKKLSWIDQYGGIVRIASRAVQDQDGNILFESFPVSCDVTKTDCWDGGKYLDLAPNDEYKSVSYIEELSPIQMIEDSDNRTRGPIRGTYKFQQHLQFVAWINNPLLGLNTCDSLPFMMKDILKTFDGKQPDSSGIRNIKAIVTSFNPRSENPFDKYDYHDVDGLVMHPYDHISFQFYIEFNASEACLSAPEFGDAILCP